MASTHILAVGSISAGSDIDWHIAPLTKHAYIEYLCSLTEDEGPSGLPAPDGSLQLAIDYGAELQELEDDMADRDFWASGQW